tara:strand:+ start:3963 stop:4091 length:129 start_codon:yes stop_codon:yes gene_type:complete
MKYLIKCCNRIVDVDNKPLFCLKCGIDRSELEVEKIEEEEEE